MNLADQVVRAYASLVGQFSGPDPEERETLVLKDWAELQDKKKLELIYEEDGYLSAIVITVKDQKSVFGSPPPEKEISRVHTVQLECNQWLEGFEVTISDLIETRIAGPVGITNVDVWIYGQEPVRGSYVTKHPRKRLILPSDGHVLVGITGCIVRYRISSLGFIECKDDYEAEPRFRRRPTTDENTRNRTWKNRVPPPNVRIMKDHLEDLPQSDLDQRQMEALYFYNPAGIEMLGEGREPAQSYMTQFAVRSNMGKILISYDSNKDSQLSKDPRKGFKTFQMDAAKGERIVSIQVAHLRPGYDGVKGFKVVTNRGRQAIFGTDPDSYDDMEDGKKFLVLSAPEGYQLVGIYGCWAGISHNPSYIRRCGRIGPLIAPGPAGKEQEITLNNYLGFSWDPEPPPSSLGLYKTRIGGVIDGDDTSSKSTATFLDLNKRVLNIRGMLAAPYWKELDSLHGFQLEFGDGDSCFVGTPAHVDQVPIHEPLRDYRDEWLNPGPTVLTSPRDREALLHVSTLAEVQAQNEHEGIEWSTGNSLGALITLVRVWHGEYLHGFQFVMDNGGESPKWGKAGGHPRTVFASEFVAKGEQQDKRYPQVKHVHSMAGIIFLLQLSSGYPSNRVMTVSALQGLGKEDQERHES